MQHLAFDLYGLTPEEVQLLRTTAPPRDPLSLVEAASAQRRGGQGGEQTPECYRPATESG